MGDGYEQFYRTWCYSGRSVSGADGWKVRAKSDGLPLPAAEGMGDLASYWCPTEFSREAPPGRRLALFRQQNDSVLVHGAPVVGLVGGRGGVSFEHGVVGLPKGVSALEAVRLWRSPAWVVEDGTFSPKLERFAWDAIARGPNFWVQAGGASSRDGDDGVALEILNRGDVMPWGAYVLRACLAAADGTVEKVFLASKDDTIVRLLFLAFYCLPERLRSKLTFSTHENPKATKGVQIVGVTTFEGEETDLPRHCYEGKYCALNIFTGDKTESLRTSFFAEMAIQWILYGQYGLLAAVRANFDALDPADNPGVTELDLLAKFPPMGGEAPAVTEGLLKLCGSAAIGHAKLRDRNEFRLLIAAARNSIEVKEGLVAQFRIWLPSHKVALEELPKQMAEAGFEGMREGGSFDDLAWLGEFGGALGNCEQRYWEGLLMKCHEGIGGETIFPALETRIGLIGRWEKWHRLEGEGRKDAFSEVVEKWLQVHPFELGGVLSSELTEDLRREAVRLWLRSGIPDCFRKVVEEGRKSPEFRDQVVGQLRGLAKEQSNSLNGFSQQLAGVGLSDLKLRCGFADVEWLGKLAGEVGQGTERDFWEQLLASCAIGASRPEPGTNFLPALETRIRLFEKWEKAAKAGRNERLQSLAEAWLRGVPQEVVTVLESGLSVSLKMTGLRICFSRSAPVESREAATILNLVCKDVALTRAVFFEMPGWQAGTAVKRVPEDCFRILLACQDNQLRLADLLEERTLEAVEFWNRNAPKAVPLRLRTRLSFGCYAKNPSSFKQATALDPELRKPEFWARERDKDAAVNGAVDRLLSSGDLSDFERGLEWFGAGKWTTSDADLIELACGRMTNIPAACRDASLGRVLRVLTAVLKESRKGLAGRVGSSTAGKNYMAELQAGDYDVLVRVAKRYLPGSSFLRSPTGHQVIEALQNDKQVVDPLQRGWTEHLHSLLGVLKATEFRSEMIETLAKSYVALDKESDADMRREVNALLLKLVAEKPKALLLALVKFVNNVYTINENLFLRGFMPGLVEELIRLERRSESGAVAEVFVSFCLEGCFLEQGGNFADRRKKEMDEWLSQFKRGLTPKSTVRVNRAARGWDAETRDLWYKESGYRPSRVSAWLLAWKDRREERRLQKKQKN